jgi:hypothetical protein
MALAQSRRMTRPPLGKVTPCAGECRAPALAAQSLPQSSYEHGARFAPAALAWRQAAGVLEPGRALLGAAASALSRLMPGR